MLAEAEEGLAILAARILLKEAAQNQIAGVVCAVLEGVPAVHPEQSERLDPAERGAPGIFSSSSGERTQEKMVYQPVRLALESSPLIHLIPAS